MIYIVKWKGCQVAASLTDDEKDRLEKSLKAIREYVDFPKPTVILSAVQNAFGVLTYSDARKEIAKKIGVSELP